MPMENGSTRGENLEAIARTSRQRGLPPPKDLIPPEIPYIGEYLIQLFWDIWHGENIKWEDFYYYQKVTGNVLLMEEIDIIRNLSNYATRYMNKEQAKRFEKKNVKKKPKKKRR